MAVDLATLQDDQGFEIATANLGTIRCGPFVIRRQLEIARAPKGRREDPRKFACLLLSVIGTRPGHTDGDSERLTFEDAEGLSDSEIESFARQFLEKNRWSVKETQREVETPSATATAPSAVASLFAGYQEYLSKQKDMIGRVLPDLSKLGAIGDLARKVQDAMPFRHENAEWLDRLTRQNQNLSAIANSSILEMERLRKSLSAAESMGRLMPEPLEFKIPPPPPNPIHETNQKLGQLIGSTEEFRAAADEWTKTALQDFAANAKQNLRYGRIMIFAGFAAVFASVLVPIYLQSRGERAAAQSRAALMKTIRQYVSERDAADKEVSTLLRESIMAHQAQGSSRSQGSHRQEDRRVPGQTTGRTGVKRP